MPRRILYLFGKREAIMREKRERRKNILRNCLRANTKKKKELKICIRGLSTPADGHNRTKDFVYIQMNTH